MVDDRFKAVPADVLVLGVAVVNPGVPVPPPMPEIGGISPDTALANQMYVITMTGTGLAATAGLELVGPVTTIHVVQNVTDTGFSADIMMPAEGGVYDVVAKDAAHETIAELTGGLTLTAYPAAKIDSVTPASVAPGATPTFQVVGEGLILTTKGVLNGPELYEGPAANITDTGFDFAPNPTYPVNVEGVYDLMSYTNRETARLAAAVTVTALPRESEGVHPLGWIKKHLPGVGE